MGKTPFSIVLITFNQIQYILKWECLVFSSYNPNHNLSLLHSAPHLHFILPYLHPYTTYSMDSFATTRVQLLEEKGEDSPSSVHADVATVVT